jgi:hypothetical protein
MGETTIKFGSGHCCICSQVCGHINGPWFCAAHEPKVVAGGVVESLGINEPTAVVAHHHHDQFWHTHGGLIGAGSHEHPDVPIATLFAEMFPWGQPDPCGKTGSN